MEPFAIGLIGVGVLLVLLILGVHIGIALGIVGLAGIALLASPGAAISSAVTTIFYFVTEYTFVVLPLFILMGLTAAQGKIADDSYESLNKWVGHIPGGAAIATVGAIAAFGTVTGSAMVAAATFTRVSIPILRRMGYEKRFSYGMVAAASAIAMLIPPSALAVVYGLLSGESVGKLLLAGIGPGLLMTLLFILSIFIMVKMNPALAGNAQLKALAWRERILALPRMWPIGVAATVIIGGIYMGAFTVVEASGIGAFALLLIGFLTRRIGRGHMWASLNESVHISVMVFLIFGAARIFSRFLVISGISPWLVGVVVDLGLTPLSFVIAVSVLFLILGCFLDSISMLCIVIPLLVPIIERLRIDPIWFAMVSLVAIHVGLITPPIGLNAYATKGAAAEDVTLEDVFRGSLPFFFLMVGTLALVIAFPAISTWIPNLIK